MSADDELAASAKALNEAVAAGDLDGVRSLIGEHISVYRPDNSGQTPIFVALRDGKDAVVKLFIAHGLDVNTPVDRHGRKPLTYAAEYGHLDVVRTLVASGATIDGLDDNGQSPLWACVFKLANIALNVPNPAQWRSAQDAAPTAQAAVAETLIHAGADVNSAPKEADPAAKFIRDVGIPRLLALLEGREAKRSLWGRLFGGA